MLKINPLVSVVVTTKNEQKNIRVCLESIKAQTWKNIEIIVVDNYSTDGTVGIAKDYTDLVFSRGPERSAQRNFGILEQAKGEYGMYIDADMLLSPNLITACVDYIQRPGVVALFVPEVVLGKSYFGKVRRFERSFYNGTPIDGSRFFCLRSFRHAGGFDEAIFHQGSGEDWDIDKSLRQIGGILLLPDCYKLNIEEVWPLKSFVESRGVAHSDRFCGIYHNESEFNLKNYLKKKSYYSLGFENYIRKWGKEDPDIKCQLGFSYRYWKVFTENGKWRRLLSRLDLTFGMYFLRICVGLVFLLKRQKRDA